MTFSTGLSGLKAATAELGITGNNIANTSTNGFKESRGEFSDVYAASALGTSSSAIGAGIRLTRVAQQFTQGTVTFTENNLDLAVNGLGFFSLDKGGERLYTRAGSFGVDRDGNIVNGDGARLRGFLPDFSTNPEGDISGAVGTLLLDTANIPPVATTSITTTLNLDSSSTAPKVPFSTGFTTANPPALSTFTSSSSVNIYDSLGNSHILSMYFVKTPTPNQWQLFLGVDGKDVTSSPTTATPNPFTLLFDANGAFIPNDPTKPPTITSAASVTGAVPALVNTGSPSLLASGDLTINGVTVGAASSDGISSADSAASAIAISNAINAASVPGLSTTVNANNLNLGIYSPPAPATTAYAAGDLLVNGVDMSTINGGSGAGVFDTPAVMAAGINSITGLTAIADGSNNIIITAADGRNIQVKTDGTPPSGATFGSFSLGTPADRVQRGSVSITQTGANSITIAGNEPLDAGFTPGTTFASVSQSNSDVITIRDYDPNTGASTQTINMDFSSSTQFGSSFAIQSLVQNGSTTGRLAGVDADPTGVLFARFTNGRSRKLGQIILANFSNAQGLQPQGNTNWSETFASGVALEGVPLSSNLGAIQAGALEDSNVKLTEELVDLIEAQRNFQANAQTIRTADTTTQTIINIR